MKRLDLPHVTADFLCPVNGLCDIYQWKTGERVPEELIQGARLGFQLISQDKAHPPKMIFWGQGTIGKDQLDYWKDLIGYNVIASEGKPFSQTLSEAKSLLDQDIPVILFGLDMYHLPYHRNYYHKQHIPGHVILMVGYDDKAVFVHDNSKADVQTVPNSDLQQAWAQDYIGISRKNTYFGIDMCRPNRDIAGIVQCGIGRNAALYLNSPVDFIGARGFEKYLDELPLWATSFPPETMKQIYLHQIEFTASTVPEVPEVLSGFHSGIDNPHQAGRDKYADVLLKYRHQYGTERRGTAAKALRESGLRIETIVNENIKDVLAMRFNDVTKYIPLLTDIKRIEKCAIEELQTEKPLI